MSIDITIKQTVSTGQNNLKVMKDQCDQYSIKTSNSILLMIAVCFSESPIHR